MSINITNFAWVAFIVLSILMEEQYWPLVYVVSGEWYYCFFAVL